MTGNTRLRIGAFLLGCFITTQTVAFTSSVTRGSVSSIRVRHPLRSEAILFGELDTPRKSHKYNLSEQFKFMKPLSLQLVFKSLKKIQARRVLGNLLVGLLLWIAVKSPSHAMSESSTTTSPYSNAAVIQRSQSKDTSEDYVSCATEVAPAISIQEKIAREHEAHLVSPIYRIYRYDCNREFNVHRP